MDKYDKICSAWKTLELESRNDLENCLESFKVLFAYHSGRIENDQITYDDTKEVFDRDALTAYTGDIRTIFEIQNQRICYEFLLDKIIEKEPLSIDLIKQIHKKLARGTYDERRYHFNNERPGEYKKHDYVTGPDEIGLPPEEVSDAMENLLAQVNEPVENVLVTAAFLHAWFEYIHPFADANGRTGRTILNYFLLINNHPPVVIKNEEKKDYLNALRAFDREEDLNPLIDFLKAATVNTWERMLSRTKRQ